MGKIHQAALKGDIAEVTRLLDEGGALKLVTLQRGRRPHSVGGGADQALLECHPGTRVDEDDCWYNYCDGEGPLFGRWWEWRLKRKFEVRGGDS